jgi:hypothetical protein
MAQQKLRLSLEDDSPGKHLRENPETLRGTFP